MISTDGGIGFIKPVTTLKCFYNLESTNWFLVTGLEDEDTPDDQMCSKLERRRNSNYESADGERKPLDEATLYAVNAKLCPVDPVCGNSNGQILKLMSSYTTELKHISLLQPEELRSTQPHFNLLQNYCTWNNSHVRFSPLRPKAIDDSVLLKTYLFSNKIVWDILQ